MPVGSTRLVEQALGRSDIPVVSNPEFLREGSAVDDFLHPDRVVIGSDDDAAAPVWHRSMSIAVHRSWSRIRRPPRRVSTPPMPFSPRNQFTNAIAAVCEAVGADANDVLLGMGYDHRIGHEFLRPAPLGRLLLSEGLQPIIWIAEDAGMTAPCAVIQANDEQFDRIVRKVESVTSLDGGTVGVLGIAFKAAPTTPASLPPLP